jgi:hypothetical protein
MPHLPDSQLNVFFEMPVGWSGVPNIHHWDNDGGVAGSAWPGDAMTATGTGNWFTFEFPVGVTTSNVIFNDGTNQTANLNRVGDGCYSGDAWADFCTDNPQP